MSSFNRSSKWFLFPPSKGSLSHERPAQTTFSISSDAPSVDPVAEVLLTVYRHFSTVSAAFQNRRFVRMGIR
jgi:hypothetical protein